jgi:lysozyme
MSSWLEMALPLVAAFEGCEKRRGDQIYPYLDKLAKPPVWTRGYGRTYGITENSQAITKEEAKKELAEGLASYARQCIIYAPALAGRPACLTAVSSWAWNCGMGAFRVSRLRRAINASKWDDAAEYIKTPRTAGGVEVGGLVRRRNAEAALFRMGI